MIIFFNNATRDLVQKITLHKAHFIIKQFSDGEIYVKIEDDVAHKEVYVVASTGAPAKNLVELFFLLDALMRAGAQKINLFFTYFGYARQAVALPGEASSAQLICTILKKFPLHKIYSMHIHSADLMKTFLTFTNVIDINFFCNLAKNYDTIAAPDKGAAEFAQNVANACAKEIVFLHKMRPEHEKVRIESVDGIVSGKKILLVDDIISTGRTLIEAGTMLKKLGALEVSAAATHGVFSEGSYERLEESCLKKIYVTNTLKNFSKGKVDVIDISSFIERTITNNYKPEG